MKYTNMNNIFVVLIVSLVSTQLFNLVNEKIINKVKKISFNTAVLVILPIFISLNIFTTLSISIFQISGYNFNDFISKLSSLPFEKLGATYIGGLLITLISSLLFSLEFQ